MVFVLRAAAESAAVAAAGRGAGLALPAPAAMSFHVDMPAADVQAAQAKAAMLVQWVHMMLFNSWNCSACACAGGGGGGGGGGGRLLHISHLDIFFMLSQFFTVARSLL